jgi:hypothetical protein
VGLVCGGDFLKHLLEGLPCGFAEKAEFPGVVSEDGAQKLWDGEDELGVADLFEDVSVKPLGEKQGALLLARGGKTTCIYMSRLEEISRNQPVA